MSEQAISKEAQVGAKWWADKLRSGFEPDNGPAHEEGTVANIKQNSSSPFVSELFSREKDERACTPEKIDAFEKALVKGIEELLDECRSPYGSTFGVDYHPEPILAKALADADIPETMTTLPWKTHMRVLPGSVRVGDGRGAEFKEIFA
jgi:hypothetical protein